MEAVGKYVKYDDRIFIDGIHVNGVEYAAKIVRQDGDRLWVEPELSRRGKIIFLSDILRGKKLSFVSEEEAIAIDKSLEEHLELIASLNKGSIIRHGSGGALVDRPKPTPSDDDNSGIGIDSWNDKYFG